MGKLTDDIKKQILEAMKARDSVRLGTLKMLSSELHNEAINKKADLTDEDELTVVKREVKKRKDAIEAYKKAGSGDKAEQEEQELAVLMEYMPEQMSDEDLAKIISDSIDQTGASGVADMGKVIGMVMGKVGGKADGGKVAAMVREKLTS